MEILSLTGYTDWTRNPEVKTGKLNNSAKVMLGAEIFFNNKDL